MHSEREDYFFRSRLYGDTRVLVAEDRARGRLFGVLAAATKDLYICGLVRPAAFFFDLRVHPDYRVSVRGRHILVAWKAMERWAEERGAHLIYGLMKRDNAAMTALVDRRLGYRFAGGMTFQSRPVFGRVRVDGAPEEIPSDDPRLVERTWAEYGDPLGLQAPPTRLFRLRTAPPAAPHPARRREHRVLPRVQPSGGRTRGNPVVARVG